MAKQRYKNGRPRRSRAQLSHSTNVMSKVNELRVAGWLMEHGFSVLWPAGDHEQYDLVFEIPDVGFGRVQVKTASLHRKVDGNEYVMARTTSVKNRKYEDGAFDFYAFIHAETDRIWFVPVDELYSSCSSAILESYKGTSKSEEHYKKYVNNLPFVNESDEERS